MLDAMASTWVFMDIGTGTATSELGQTELGSSLGKRVVIEKMNATSVTLQMRGVFNKNLFTSSNNVTEIGVFDASTAGNMIFRTVSSTNTWSTFAVSSTQTAIASVNVVLN